MEPDDRFADEYERAAGGLDLDDVVRERASSFGEQLASGPDALFEEVENLLPETWKKQISDFPLTAVCIGVGIGVFLGMKKGDELIAAGSSMLAAAATANLHKALGHMGEE
ncbi:MAG TPA: hypothetical protein VIL97_02215 [Thermoanaerobaculia bacterium]